MVRFTKELVEGMLGDVPQDKWFWCSDGRTLRSLPELEAALEGMSEETFCSHSNEAKSDFSIWVRDVIGDDKLSRDLLKSTTQDRASKSVASRTAWVRSKLASG